MNFRIKISVLLVGLGIILAFLPAPKNNVFRLSPEEFGLRLNSEENTFTADQVARFVNNEDTSVLLIDVRSSNEFRECNIPGSVNIPLNDLLNPDWEGYLNQDKVKTVFYSNGGLGAALALSVTTGLGYKNNYMMKGGMNEWFEMVMLSEYSGQSISPRENALFENRYKARRNFTAFNSLPDSLKLRFAEAKRLKESQLDGGCE